MRWLRQLFEFRAKPTCIAGEIYGIVTGIDQISYDSDRSYLRIRFTDGCNDCRGNGVLHVSKAMGDRLRIGSVVDVFARALDE